MTGSSLEENAGPTSQVEGGCFRSLASTSAPGFSLDQTNPPVGKLIRVGRFE